MKKHSPSGLLLVDDRATNLLVLEGILSDSGYRLMRALSGDEALKIVLKEQVDLIIMDVKMPDLDGFETAKILKSNSRSRDIPIIFVTADQREQSSVLKGYEEGAFDYLLKPIDPALLKAKIHVLLKLHLQKKELQEKNESLLRQELLINNSADIIGIVDLKTLTIVEMNQAWTKTLGYSIEESQNTSLDLILSTEDRKKVKKLIESKHPNPSFETAVYCKNRQVKWLQWNVVLKDNLWFVNARDITVIRQVEKVRNYLTTVVKQSTDAIYIHDNEGKIISWNMGAEQIYGYTESEALNMKIWNIIPDYLQKGADDTIQQVLSGQRIQNLETIRITKHGSLIDVLFSASPLQDPDGYNMTIAITEKDITQEKLAETRIKKLNNDLRRNLIQLEVTNKELESFSYSVSHDLRAPLRSINGFAKILSDELGKNATEEQKRLTGVIQANAIKMGILIDDLLSFSRLGRKEIQKTCCHINDLIAGILTEMNGQITEKYTITVDKLPDCMADPALIKQVWMNLISNAVKYSSKRERPIISIESRAQDEEIIYFIKDNGAGFDMKYVEKIFGVFQRLHTSDDFEGTGVGLAIVQRIITKHGGRVWVEAEPDVGATFYFSLPIETGEI